MNIREAMAEMEMIRDIFIDERCVTDKDVEEVTAEFNIAFAAMEKQIHKNPIKNDKYYTCPACKYDFPDIGGAMESYGESEKYDYCPNCGNAICYEKEGLENEK